MPPINVFKGSMALFGNLMHIGLEVLQWKEKWGRNISPNSKINSLYILSLAFADLLVGVRLYSYI